MPHTHEKGGRRVDPGAKREKEREKISETSYDGKNEWTAGREKKEKCMAGLLYPISQKETGYVTYSSTGERHKVCLTVVLI